MVFAESSCKASEMELERLMTCYGDEIKRLCCLYTKDMALAEDAAQETFIKAWRSYDQFRGDCSEKTWLTHIAVNICRDMLRTAWFRRMDRRRVPEELPLIQEGSMPDPTLAQEIMALSRPYREVILLYYYQGFNAAEIAEILGANVSTVKSRLQRAREKLKLKLEGWYWNE